MNGAILPDWQGQISPVTFAAAAGNIALLMQTDPEPPLVVAVRAYLAETGESPRALSLKIGKNETLIRKLLGGTTTGARGETLVAIARAIGRSVEELSAPPAPRPPRSEVRAAPEIDLDIPANRPRDLPVYGSAAGGNGDGAMIINQGDVVDYQRRPAGLAGNRKAYGLYVEGDSMVPAILHGDLIIVDAGKKVRPGDRAVFLLASEDEPDGEVAFVKEVVRETTDRWIARQFNPPKELIFMKAAVKSVGRVLTTIEIVNG